MNGRHQRRLAKQKIANLETSIARMRRELVLAQDALGTTEEEFVQAIEIYVDGLAQVLNCTDKTDSPVFQETPDIYEALARVGWRGVATPEAAKDELSQEVACRSVGRTDLALLLSSIDHVAIGLYGAGLPDGLRDLRGEALVEAGAERLTVEDFPAELVKDARWAQMRGRWVRLGWRGATEETFAATYVRAVVERVALIQDGVGDDVVRGGLSLLHDTVIDEQLKRMRPEARAQMERAFKERLDREYDLLRRPTVAERDRALGVAIDFLEKTSPSPPAAPTIQVESAARAYSDHALMRHGRELWGMTYADAMTDEEVRDVLRLSVVEDGSGRWSDDVSFFSAKWAVHAFQRLMTSHTFAAALMCSDVQREVLEGIEEQWDAFLVIVPNGMLLAGGFEFSRVLVGTYSFGAWLGLLAPDGAGFRLLTADAPNLQMLLASEESDLQLDSVAQRCLVMAKRLVAGLLLNLQELGAYKVRKVEARPKGLRREGEPEHRIVTIGAPLEIDCRDAVREYVEHGTRSSEKTGKRRHGTPTVQWMVRGHYRMQAHGPKHTLRRKTWIRPFWKGNEAALIQTRPKVPVGAKTPEVS